MSQMSYYLYAIFVFLLAMVFLLVLRRVLKAKGQTELTADMMERERKLLKLYQYLEDMMDSFEKFVEETESELSRAKEETIAEIRGHLDKPNASVIEVAETAKAEEASEPEAQALTGKNEMVVKLHYQGKTADEISRELGISQGEIALILQLVGK